MVPGWTGGSNTNAGASYVRSRGIVVHALIVVSAAIVAVLVGRSGLVQDYRRTSVVNGEMTGGGHSTRSLSPVSLDTEICGEASIERFKDLLVRQYLRCLVEELTREHSKPSPTHEEIRSAILASDNDETPLGAKSACRQGAFTQRVYEN